MRKMKKHGQTLVEYGLVVSLIAVVAVAIITILGRTFTKAIAKDKAKAVKIVEQETAELKQLAGSKPGVEFRWIVDDNTAYTCVITDINHAKVAIGNPKPTRRVFRILSLVEFDAHEKPAPAQKPETDSDDYGATLDSP